MNRRLEGEELGGNRVVVNDDRPTLSRYDRVHISPFYEVFGVMAFRAEARTSVIRAENERRRERRGLGGREVPDLVT